MSFLDVTNDKSSSFEALPAGKHPAIIDEVEVVETKSGRAIKAKFRVFEGENKGRVVYNYFNFVNSSEEAQRIGRGQIKAFCLAAGIPTVLESPTDMMGRKVTITTAVRRTEEFGDQARITSFQKYEEDQKIPF